MYTLRSDLSEEKTLSKIESTVNEFNIFKPMFGFIGRVCWDKNSFWVVNQSSIYKSRHGFRFRTYRRFEGVIVHDSKMVLIKGDFKLRPLHKVTMIIYLVFMCILGVLGLVFAVEIMDKIKLGSIAVLMLTFGWAVMKFNIYKTKESESEIIDFIETIIKA